MLKAIIKASDFLYMSRFVSDDETRYYLRGVFIDLVNGRMVATDGHRLGLLKPFTDEARFACNEASVILSANKTLLQACKATRYEQKWLRLFVDRVEVISTSVNMETTAEAMRDYDGPVAITLPALSCYIDGTFPDYDRIIPDTVEPMDSAPFNAEYLSSFSGPVKDEKGIVLASSGKGMPALVANGDPRFIGVIMPFRDTQGPLDRCRSLMGRNIATMPEAAAAD